MAKINKKVNKDAERDNKLSKVADKSLTIQKVDKIKKEKAVKNLKKVVKSPTMEASSITQTMQNNSPKKGKPAKTNKKTKSVKIEKKTTVGGGAPIGPNKNAKMIPKASKAKAKAGGPTKDLVSKEDIAKSFTACKTIVQAGLAEKKAMLDPDFRYMLQICVRKIPDCPERVARTSLVHSLYDDTDDVCLFVKDIEPGHKRDYQPSIDYFREKLDAAGITNIKTIMPIAQLVQEFKQNEMNRKLLKSYDLFLTDSRVAPHLSKMLGKHFQRYKKSPIAVRMDHKNLKEHFDLAMKKVQYQQVSTGNSTSIYVGKNSMDIDQVVDNIHQVLLNMCDQLPGGWPNIRRVYLRPTLELPKCSVLVYSCPDSDEDVPVPVIDGPRRKAVAEKQKQLNKLLPEGMTITSKGELAIVGPGNTNQGKSGHAERKPNKKDKKAAQKNKAPVEDTELVAKKKTKKIDEPVAVKVVEKKAKKNKALPVEPQVDKKKTKELAAELPVPVKVDKKNKTGKASKAAVNEDDADLSKEVSALWEQIKNDSSSNVDSELQQMESETAAELEDGPKKAKKKNKRQAEAVVSTVTDAKKPKADKKQKKN